MQHQAIDSHHGELHDDEDHNHGGEDHHEEENNPEWRNEQFMVSLEYSLIVVEFVKSQDIAY